MFFELVLFTLIGCCMGIMTGLIPGLHINMVAVFVLLAMPFLADFSTLAIAAAIISMSVVHSFLDFIPGILLGAPDADTILSVLPGHTMLFEGRGIEAIKLTGIGSLFSLLITASLFLFIVKFIPAGHAFLKPIMHFVLLAVVLLGIVFEKKVFWSVVVFLISGAFGFLILSNPFNEQIIFPALSGLFGISTLLLSLKANAAIPMQRNTPIGLSFRECFKNSALGTFAGMIVGLLPGLGSAQAAYITQQASQNSGPEEFLVAVSGVNTANIIFPLVVMYSIGKLRSGIVIVVEQIVGNLVYADLVLFLGVILLAGGIAMILHMKIGVFLTNWLGDKDSSAYQKISLGIIFAIVLMVFLVTGFQGLGILVLGTLIGFMPPTIGVRRAQCMGFFVFPVILFYSGLNYVLLNFIY